MSSSSKEINQQDCRRERHAGQLGGRNSGVYEAVDHQQRTQFAQANSVGIEY
jgi:hypothetical protein